MNDPWSLGLAFVLGSGLGAGFFGGLWWGLRRGLRSANPALWVAGSQVLRTGLAVAGFWAVSGGSWERLAACLGGFLGARFLVSRVLVRKGVPDAP